jgi:hypothetical protein
VLGESRPIGCRTLPEVRAHDCRNPLGNQRRNQVAAPRARPGRLDRGGQRVLP